MNVRKYERILYYIYKLSIWGQRGMYTARRYVTYSQETPCFFLCKGE